MECLEDAVKLESNILLIFKDETPKNKAFDRVSGILSGYFSDDNLRKYYRRASGIDVRQALYKNEHNQLIATYSLSVNYNDPRQIKPVRIKIGSVVVTCVLTHGYIKYGFAKFYMVNRQPNRKPISHYINEKALSAKVAEDIFVYVKAAIKS